MPLQNRVDPFGAIHAVAARGAFMGNRGIIHDGDGRTRTLLKRRWTTKAWLICVCQFKGRRRTVMSPSRYTELFFLDEATALAAGHRPCFECRRADAVAFAEAFAEGRGRPAMRVAEIDAVLHGERVAAGHATLPLDRSALATLPDGAMIAVDGAACLLRGVAARPWSFEGYGDPLPLDRLSGRDLRLVTPPSTVAALRAGYRPVSDPTSA
ncbi:MAG: hypothetical protein ACTHJ3_13135 [Pararhizobium sp.]